MTSNQFNVLVISHAEPLCDVKALHTLVFSQRASPILTIKKPIRVDQKKRI